MGIIYTNPPTQGKVNDATLMDLYYTRMNEGYASRSHTYSKDLPEMFHKLMKANKFMSHHPMFEVEFSTDGSKLPPTHTNSIRKNSLPENSEDVMYNSEKSATFVSALRRKERPVGREQSKRVDAINLVVDKVSEKAASRQQNYSLFLQDMWLKIESAIQLLEN